MFRVKAAIVGWLVIFAAAVSQAADVKLLYDSLDVFVDVPFAVAIDVVTTDDVTTERPVFPQIENAVVSDGSENTSRNRSIQIVNGRRSETTTITTRYLYSVIAKEPGKLRVPPVIVNVGGENYETRSVTFRVTRSETGDLMFVDIDSTKESAYVGEPIDLTLKIGLKGFVQNRQKLDASDMWGCIDKESSSWGPFADLVQQPQQNVTVQGVRRKGEDGEVKDYFVYTIKKRVWPAKAGEVAGGDIRIVAKYPLRVERGFWGSQVTRAKPISAAVENSPVVVKSIPMQGRPPSFRGAVGKHTINATASPVKVSVGDPITLTIAVNGSGRMDLIQSPSLADLAEFTNDFRVAEDQLAGVVEGDVKRFTQSIRALNDKVTEIPPIPFTYFDPANERFVTVYSGAIDIEVEAAERMSASQIVESVDPGNRKAESLTQLDRGIESNYLDPKELLVQQGFHPTVVSATSAAAAPLVYLICLFIRAKRKRSETDVAYARRKTARKNALKKVSMVVKDGPETTAAELANALLGYIADRLNLPTGGLIRKEAIESLRQAGVDQDSLDMVDRILLDCEAVQFGGLQAGSAQEITVRAKSGIEKLERQRF